jgi:hypothetical protein
MVTTIIMCSEYLMLLASSNFPMIKSILPSTTFPALSKEGLYKNGIYETSLAKVRSCNLKILVSRADLQIIWKTTVDFNGAHLTKAPTIRIAFRIRA